MLTIAKGEWTRRDARHLLSRAGFGGSPDEIEKLYGMGREGAVDFLLSPKEEIGAFPMPEWVDMEAAREQLMDMMDARKERMSDEKGKTPEQVAEARRKMAKELRRELQKQGVEAQGWWFRRILKTEAPLREKMTLFWHDHFATSFQKVKRPIFLMKQNDLFRRNAFGSFKSLTQEVVRDPAMMLYLDTQRSDKASPNENFAREVMELFTLGEGNYTEMDVKEAARAFTGYRLNPLNGKVAQSERRWDEGEKTIFGEKGKFNGTDVVKLIFRKEQCADFMAAKVWEYFVEEGADEKVVKFLGEVLRKADYEMKPMLRAVFLSEEFYAESVVGMQIKSPVQYLVQMLKELEVKDVPFGFAIQGQTQLGQVLFMPPNVAGWDWGKAWINTNTLLVRYNLAGALTKGGMDEGQGGKMIKRGGMRQVANPDFEKIAANEKRADVEGLVDMLIGRFFGAGVPEKAKKSFVEYAQTKAGVSFTDKELGELCHLMMSTPYYQLC
jgi:uncharacterized protein (DUF1800 family)